MIVFILLALPRLKQSLLAQDYRTVIVMQGIQIDSKLGQGEPQQCEAIYCACGPVIAKH